MDLPGILNSNHFFSDTYFLRAWMRDDLAVLCQKYWYSNLGFFNNFTPNSEQCKKYDFSFLNMCRCLVELVYCEWFFFFVSAFPHIVLDMQFFIVTPPIVIIYAWTDRKWLKKLMFLVAFLMFFICIVLRGE